MRLPWKRGDDPESPTFEELFDAHIRGVESVLEGHRGSIEDALVEKLELLDKVIQERVEAALEAVMAAQAELHQEAERFAQRSEASAARAKMYVDERHSGGRNRARPGPEVPEVNPHPPGSTEAADFEAAAPDRAAYRASKADLFRLHGVV